MTTESATDDLLVCKFVSSSAVVMASDEVNILANPLNTENIVNEAENVDPTGSTEKEAAHEQQEPIEAANVTLTRCQHIFEQLSGASCGECNAYPKCKVSK